VGGGAANGYKFHHLTCSLTERCDIIRPCGSIGSYTVLAWGAHGTKLIMYMDDTIPTYLGTISHGSYSSVLSLLDITVMKIEL
jgi:hypothetical protein